MLELVLANLKTRPFRTLISIIGVALGVILILLFTGLARGMSENMANRAFNLKAEIFFTRAGAMELTSSNASVSTTYAQRLLEIEGVQSTVPVIRYITPDTTGRWGLRQLDGVEWQPFAAMNDIEIVKGRAPNAGDEVIIDERQMTDDKLNVGDEMQLFGDKKYQIVGVFAPPSGARIKMSLAAMQDALEAPNKCTYILVKIKDGANASEVAARINEQLPGNKINLTQDLIIDAQDRVPGLKTFLRVLVGLGAFVSTIFVLLSMYTTITERRKEIGILKSLGASKSFVISVIEGEAFLIGVLGVLLGFTVSFLASYIIQSSFDLQFEFSRDWTLTAILIALGGSLVGALYPAWRASNIDPVLVLTNE
ncbi:MAG: ABC transporter permease [Acidobacteriota bacterium]|nr:ABC transporter permease [Acidobacteriota bacterium]